MAHLGFNPLQSAANHRRPRLQNKTKQSSSSDHSIPVHSSASSHHIPYRHIPRLQPNPTPLRTFLDFSTIHATPLHTSASNHSIPLQYTPRLSRLQFNPLQSPANHRRPRLHISPLQVPAIQTSASAQAAPSPPTALHGTSRLHHTTVHHKTSHGTPNLGFSPASAP